jgi:hypothetical protein
MTPTFFGQNISTSTGTGGGGGGGTGVALTDDFNRANSSTVGGLWTQVAGNCDISSNTLLAVSGTYAHNCLRHNTAVASITQYMKATFSGWGSNDAFIGFIFRWAVANTGPSYVVTFSALADDVTWARYSNTSAASYTTISTGSLSVVGGDTFGVTVDGTGTNTTVRVWRNCTGLPSAANNWNGDTTPSLTFTTNPPTPVDTGTGLGLALAPETSNGVYVDQWWGGSL